MKTKSLQNRLAQASRSGINEESLPRFINSKELIAFLHTTADELSKNSERLKSDGKNESAEIDENIAIYLRECLIDELAETLGIDV
ncbi:hypothetical protein [Pelagicoccus sp. SDUM812005]|uniref:hypothetical protein n=1 Tax=Pelagicoccus sp. SDUM812005 TaxID=3041257 RepID=UPI00280D9E4D|nr:hypothetical protein [Pelagicoccus sp. SDUM812005]MDQ8179141.1 hypothetical protein [Pelagicoccus sp. SDUM812005]